MNQLPSEPREAIVRMLRRMTWYLAMAYLAGFLAGLIPLVGVGLLAVLARDAGKIGTTPAFMLVLFVGAIALVQIYLVFASLRDDFEGIVPASTGVSTALLEYVGRVESLIGASFGALAVVGGGGARVVGDPAAPTLLIGEDEFDSLSVREFLAVVAHELAHVHLRHVAIGVTGSLWHQIHCRQSDFVAETTDVIEAHAQHKRNTMDESALVIAMGAVIWATANNQSLLRFVWRRLHPKLGPIYMTMELEADRLAAAIAGARALTGALERCGRSAMAKGVGMQPGAWGDGWLHLEHPPLVERLRALEGSDAEGCLAVSPLDDQCARVLVSEGSTAEIVERVEGGGRRLWKFIFGSPLVSLYHKGASKLREDLEEDEDDLVDDDDLVGDLEDDVAKDDEPKAEGEDEPGPNLISSWLGGWMALQLLAVAFYLGDRIEKVSEVLSLLVMGTVVIGGAVLLVAIWHRPRMSSIREWCERQSRALERFESIRDWETNTKPLFEGARAVVTSAVCFGLALMGCMGFAELLTDTCGVPEVWAWVYVPFVGVCMFALEALCLGTLGRLMLRGVPERGQIHESLSVNCTRCGARHTALEPDDVSVEVERVGFVEELAAMAVTGGFAFVLLSLLIPIAGLPAWVMIPIMFAIVLVAYAVMKRVMMVASQETTTYTLTCASCRGVFEVRKRVDLRTSPPSDRRQ